MELRTVLFLVAWILRGMEVRTLFMPHRMDFRIPTLLYMEAIEPLLYTSAANPEKLYSGE